MNKAYKVVYNETTGTYVAVAEIATSHTKSDATVVTVSSENKTMHGGGFRLKKLTQTHLSVAALGVFTLFALPTAHASWVNSATGGHNGAAASGDYGVVGNDTAIAIGADDGNGLATA